MAVKCKSFSASENEFRWERNLDLIFSPGCYIVEIDHEHKGLGLPIDECNEEHYISGTLIVCECGTKGPKQYDRIVGQQFVYINKKERRTNVYIRSYVSNKWSDWQHLLVSGEVDDIKTSEDMIIALNNVASNVRTLMGEESGSVKDTVNAMLKKSSVSYCVDDYVNAYIKELYVSGENAESKGFYIERIIKNTNDTCAITICSDDRSVIIYYQSTESVPYQYFKKSVDGYTLEAIINFEKVTESWGLYELNATTGKLLPWSFNIDASPCIKAIHLHEENALGIELIDEELTKLGASVSATDVIAIKGKYLQNNGKISTEYSDGYYSEFYPVMSKNQIRYTGKASGNVAAWAFYDKDKNFLSAYPATNPASTIVLDDEEVGNIPEAARFIRFGSVYQIFTAEILPANLATVSELTGLYVSNPLYKRSVDWIGASHMQGIVSGEKTGGFASIIAGRNSMVSNNYGIGGTTVAKTPGKTNSFVERIETYSKDVDYVIVMGGANDTASADITLGALTEGYEAELDTTTFYGAWEWLCKYVMENYSEKKYGFIIPFHIANNKLSGEWGDAIALVCKKWGMPYLDLRVEAGFNIYSVALRKIYGAYIGNVSAYDATKGYALDEQVKYECALYKSNTEITAPAGTFDASKWTLQESESNSDYDNWHCNTLGYRKLADKVEAWMRTL